MRHFVLLISLAFASIEAIGAEPLTESEALKQGLSRTELADIANASMSEAEAGAIEAGLWQNPSLSYSRDRINSSPGTTEHTWQITQTFDISGRRELKKSAAERLMDATLSDNAARRVVLAAEIRRAFHAVLLSQERVRAVDTWAQRFGNIETTVTKLEKAGEVSGYDRRRLSREKQSAEARLATEQSELERAREKLAALLGQPGAALPPLAGALLPAELIPLDQALNRLVGRADLRSLSHRAEASDLQRQAADKGWIPDVTVGIGPKFVEEGGSHDSGNLVTMSIPLPVFDRQQSGAKRAIAQAMTARAELALARSNAEGDVRGLYKQVSHLIHAAISYRSQAVSGSGDLTHIAESAYRAGEGGVLELLDAYRGALDAENTALDMEWKAREASIEFDSLIGNYSE